MWLFDYIPIWCVHIMLITGVICILISTFLKAIPTVSAYEVIIHIVGIILTVVSVWSEGAALEAQHWQDKIEEATSKAQQAEQFAKDANAKVITKVLTQKEIIKEKGDSVIQYIDREVIKYDNTCPVPVEAIKAMNASAQNKTIEELNK